jgi:hypothetical protein
MRPSALSLKQIVCLELGLGTMATLCALVAVVLWVLTQNAAYAMSLWDMANNAKTPGFAAGGDMPAVVAPGGLPGAEGVSAIPIEHGRQVRQQRAHRAG